jgi:hypothetical protein
MCDKKQNKNILEQKGIDKLQAKLQTRAQTCAEYERKS